MGQLSSQELAQLIAANFPPSDDLSLQPAFTGSVGAAPLNAVNDTVVEVDGNKAHVSTNATQADIDNTTSRLNAENLDEQRIAVNSGTQTNNQFIGTQQNEKRKLEAKKKAEQARKSNADLLAMLQGQLDALYEERNEGLANYLSQAEIDAINNLSREQQDQAIRDKMQEKLENGDITQAQYDAWQAWYDDWSKKEFSKQQEIQNLKEANTQQEAKVAVENIGVENSAVHAKSFDAEQRNTVENAAETLVDAGDTTKQNTVEGFSGLAAWGATSTANVTSVASQEVPTSGVLNNAPNIKLAFDVSAAPAVEKDYALTVDISYETQKDASPPSPEIA
ncbi:hypothetical protein AB835_14475 [Candidatus Endobugula sertula]|uniref:Uncharacterized protein n=1 Tax=Candidatus Endobugula sertula TaxID=62101 RepID=A0A1D2QLE5_9GAMM|nr:hypothetical protein AB835_14475 [Candidatus Endobugula sertula]